MGRDKDRAPPEHTPRLEAPGSVPHVGTVHSVVSLTPNRDVIC